MPFQVEAAEATGKSTLGIATVQNVAGSHASLLAPQRLVLAAAATGLDGREGEIALDSFDSARPKHVVYPIRSGALIVVILGTDEADFKVKAKH